MTEKEFLVKFAPGKLFKLAEGQHLPLTKLCWGSNYFVLEQVIASEIITLTLMTEQKIVSVSALRADPGIGWLEEV
jgi:hypothetical protein